MIERIEGIVTDIIRHSDTHNVVTLFTRRYGRMAFMAPVGKSKTGRMRNATLQLMAVVGSDVNIRPGKELYMLRKAESLRIWHSVYANPLKSSLIFFLAEFCNRLFRQYPADEKLWQYLVHSLETLEGLEGSKVSNFHIAFLVGLLPLTGIEPSAARWEEGDRFNMLSGEMEAPDFRLATSNLNGKNLLPEEESRFVPLLLRMRFRNMARYRFTRHERDLALRRMLAYYATHLPIGVEFKTLPILRALFD